MHLGSVSALHAILLPLTCTGLPRRHCPCPIFVQRQWARPCRNCSRTLAHPLPQRGWAHPLPHPHRDWHRDGLTRCGAGLTPCHIGTATGLTPCQIHTGTDPWRSVAPSRLLTSLGPRPAAAGDGPQPDAIRFSHARMVPRHLPRLPGDPKEDRPVFAVTSLGLPRPGLGRSPLAT